MKRWIESDRPPHFTAVRLEAVLKPRLADLVGQVGTSSEPQHFAYPTCHCDMGLWSAQIFANKSARHTSGGLGSLAVYRRFIVGGLTSQ